MKNLSSFTFLKSVLFVGFVLMLAVPSLAAAFNFQWHRVETDIPAHTNVYPMTDNQDVIGETLRVPMQRKDTLPSLAMKYDIAITELYAANPGINPHKIRVGTLINIPKMYVLPPRDVRKGIVINIPGLRIYYFDEVNHQIMTFPVALGRAGWRTPLATTEVIRKQVDPTWHAPKSIRTYMKKAHNVNLPEEIGPGPKNPLGQYAIYLGINGYLIHGTNQPDSVGKFVSSGCVRMYAPDIERLFNAVQVGTPVSIIHTPYKVGIANDNIYLEVHRPVTHKQGLYQRNTVSVEQALQELVGNRAGIDWEKVTDMMQLKTGVPEVIGRLN